MTQFVCVVVIQGQDDIDTEATPPPSIGIIHSDADAVSSNTHVIRTIRAIVHATSARVALHEVDVWLRSVVGGRPDLEVKSIELHPYG